MILVFLLLSQLFAADLSTTYQSIYSRNQILSVSDVESLKEYDFYLIPGIMAETFVWQDRRSVVDFSVLTKDYFSPQKTMLEKLGLKVKRLKASSHSVQETQEEILGLLASSRAQGRKAIFMTHSLGGLALLELLVSDPLQQDQVAGIIFLQSPFSGSPISNVYLENPKLGRWLNPILPFLNTSLETVQFLSTPVRQAFMRDNSQAIRDLLATKAVLTVGGAVYGAKSLFSATADVMMKGCVESIRGVCLSGVLYSGPKDQSDGMVPFESSKLLEADFVRLEKVDHGETIVNVPFTDLNKARMTQALMKMILQKLPR